MQEKNNIFVYLLMPRKKPLSRIEKQDAKIKLLQSKVDTGDIEGIILYFCKDKEFADDLINGFIEDNPKYSRAVWLRWFRSFGLYYSRLKPKALPEDLIRSNRVKKRKLKRGLIRKKDY